MLYNVIRNDKVVGFILDRVITLVVSRAVEEGINGFFVFFGKIILLNISPVVSAARKPSLGQRSGVIATANVLESLNRVPAYLNRVGVTSLFWRDIALHLINPL